MFIINFPSQTVSVTQLLPPSPRPSEENVLRPLNEILQVREKDRSTSTVTLLIFHHLCLIVCMSEPFRGPSPLDSPPSSPARLKLLSPALPAWQSFTVLVNRGDAPFVCWSTHADKNQIFILITEINTNKVISVSYSLNNREVQ